MNLVYYLGSYAVPKFSANCFNGTEPETGVLAVTGLLVVGAVALALALAIGVYVCAEWVRGGRR